MKTIKLIGALLILLTLGCTKDHLVEKLEPEVADKVVSSNKLDTLFAEIYRERPEDLFAFSTATYLFIHQKQTREFKPFINEYADLTAGEIFSKLESLEIGGASIGEMRRVNRTLNSYAEVKAKLDFIDKEINKVADQAALSDEVKMTYTHLLKLIGAVIRQQQDGEEGGSRGSCYECEDNCMNTYRNTIRWYGYFLPDYLDCLDLGFPQSTCQGSAYLYAEAMVRTNICEPLCEPDNQPSTTQQNYTQKPMSGDFNGDLYPDVIYYGKCGCGAGCWRTHLNNQNGGFTTISNYGDKMWFGGTGPINTPVTGDFNNDNYTDIAHYGKCGNGAACWRVHLNDRNGGFTTTSYGGSIWFEGTAPINAPIAGDFNNDGYSDIAYYGKCGNGGADCWRVHLNNKNGSFTTTSYGGSIWFEGTAPINAPVAGDFNNDGYSDIAYYGRCGNGGADCWRVHLNNKNGKFTPKSYGSSMWFEGDTPRHSLVVGDFDNNGYSDITYYGKCGNGGEGCWRTHTSSSAGTFNSPVNYGWDMWF